MNPHLADSMTEAELDAVQEEINRTLSDTRVRSHHTISCDLTTQSRGVLCLAVVQDLPISPHISPDLPISRALRSCRICRRSSVVRTGGGSNGAPRPFLDTS